MLHKPLLMLIGLLAFTTLVNAQAPVINGITPNTTSPGKYEKFEVALNLTATYTNPYDYDEIAVSATFTTPSGKVEVVEGFYMQDYVIGGNGFASPVGNATFKVRYAPSEVGVYNYVVRCTTAGGTATSAAGMFTAQPTPIHGFIRTNATNYLSFDDGSQYIPIGENMGWQNGSVVADYTNWVTKLANNGGNFIRVWMSSWAFALEWKNGTNGYEGLKRYKQSSAYYLDWLLEFCKQKDVYLMLALNNHGQVSTNVNPEWNNNPYNAANGGPAANTWDFFTNATAKALHKNRLRYIVARYGYSQQVQSWELFNELHWTNDFQNRKSDFTVWDNEMATFIKEKDVYKHLVTTSYGGDEVTTNTWALPVIDFTQTHFYVNAPNIETVLAAANQNFLTQYQKPTLNGEFGLGPAGNTLSADDPNGVHLHNAIWGSMFSGGLGSGMTWWWDDYVEPRNLYYHFNGLSTFVSLLPLKSDNYRRTVATATGTGGSDATVTPGADWGKSPQANFTIDAGGNVSPGPSTMGKFIYGSTFNTVNRNPPTFNVNYPTAGQFRVVVAGVSNDVPKVSIYLDGNLVSNEIATTGQTYSIEVPAGQHAIKVDNLGIDWFQASNFVFTNIGSPLNAYVLRSAAGNKAAGYVLNNKYNWQYMKASGNVAPPAVSGGVITIPNMANGTYTMLLYNPATGQQTGSIPVTVSSGTLSASLPNIAWDLAFRVAENSTLPIRLAGFTGQRVGRKNHLHIDISTADNVQTIYIERSANGSTFKTLQPVSNTWNSIAGKHTFIDALPPAGANYYRLKIVDHDGSVTYSGIVKLSGNSTVFRITPNPFADHFLVQVNEGKYQVRIIDQGGRLVSTENIISNGRDGVKVQMGTLPKGMYHAVVVDAGGAVVGTEKMVH